MESKNVTNSSASNGKTLRVILSPKVVRDFYIRNNMLPHSNGMQEINGYGNSSTASNSIDQIREKEIHDSEIVDSNEKRPIILLDRLNANEMKNIAMLGYLQCTSHVNGC